MYLLYLDESENSNKNCQKPLNLSVFGLSGLLITTRYITSLIDEFWKVKENNKIPEKWEVHAFEIFSGSGRWSKKFSDVERRKICNDFANLIVKRNCFKKAFFSYKESKFLREDYIESLEFILDKSINCVGKEKNTGKQLLIIFDKKDDLEKEINNFILQQRNKINNNKKQKGKMCRIIDHGFPGNSEISELLQLADFVGYVFRLSKTIKREDNLFYKKHDERFIEFVDSLVEIMKKKVVEIRIKNY
jgi:hypothetical protein